MPSSGQRVEAGPWHRQGHLCGRLWRGVGTRENAVAVVGEGGGIFRLQGEAKLHSCVEGYLPLALTAQSPQAWSWALLHDSGNRSCKAAGFPGEEARAGGGAVRGGSAGPVRGAP